MTDQIQSGSTATGGKFFAWHPTFQGRDVESVRRELADDLRRDQRAYDLALQAAEQNEQASLQSIMKLDNRWSPYDLGWTEANVDQLVGYVMAIEVERERRQDLVPVKELRHAVAPLPASHKRDDGDDEDNVSASVGPIPQPLLISISLLVVIGLVALLVSQVF